MVCKNRILANIAEDRRRYRLESVLPYPLGVWYFRLTERRALRNGGLDVLIDAGISRADAIREADKPFWKC